MIEIIGLQPNDLNGANDTSFKDPMPDPTLPGGGLPGIGCGDDLLLGCGECGQVHTVTSRCMKRECPDCWRSWAHKLAKKSSLRMWSGGLFKMKGRRGFRFLHVVISFPHGDLKDLRKQCRVVAKDHGISGGLTIYHPFRQDDDHQFVPDGYVHFHIIGLAVGHVKPGSEGLGYVFKVIKDAKRKDYRGFRRPRDISACVYYLLTHCGVIRGSHALTYFGALSYNMFNNEAWETHFPEVINYLKPTRSQCPHCGSTDTYPIFEWELSIPEECNPPIPREIIVWDEFT